LKVFSLISIDGVSSHAACQRSWFIAIRGGLGKEQITLFASDVEFASGKILRGKDVTDRLVHTTQTLEKKDGRMTIVGDPTLVVKKTLEIETR